MESHKGMVNVLVDLIEYARTNGLLTLESDLLAALFASGIKEAEDAADCMMERHLERRSHVEMHPTPTQVHSF